MVYDLNGSMVGKVVHINKVKNTNKLISLDVSHGIRKHNIVVQAASIKKVSESILLNIEM
jgi:tRNA-binding EMAP/Myf-like protein